jgi:threonine dehydrogenase-like Zn-dependent dehydrogenase
VAKAGTLSIIGVYPQTVNFFPLGMAMNKNLTINMGNCNHRRYIPELIELVESEVVDPTMILTQTEPMDYVMNAYEAFDARRSGWIKVKIEPGK